MAEDFEKGMSLSRSSVTGFPSTIGRSMVAMVPKERHLWLNLADIKEKERNFLLDVPVLPSEFFGTSEEMVVGKFKEVRLFRWYIPHRSKSSPKTSEGPWSITI